MEKSVKFKNKIIKCRPKIYKMKKKAKFNNQEIWKTISILKIIKCRKKMKKRSNSNNQKMVNLNLTMSNSKTIKYSRNKRKM